MFRNYEQSTMNNSFASLNSSVLSNNNIVRDKNYFKRNKITGLYRNYDVITG